MSIHQLLKLMFDPGPLPNSQQDAVLIEKMQLFVCVLLHSAFYEKDHAILAINIHPNQRPAYKINYSMYSIQPSSSIYTFKNDYQYHILFYEGIVYSYSRPCLFAIYYFGINLKFATDLKTNQP